MIISFGCFRCSDWFRLLPLAACLAWLAATGPAGAQGKPLTAEQQAREDWRAKLAAQPTGTQCRVATYPETVWHEVPCAKLGSVKEVPYILPNRRLHSLDEHASHNITAKSSGSISSSTGSIYQLSNLGPANTQPATYSVQMNTNGFQPTPLCKGSTNTACLGWEQFVLDSNGTLFIQTWLGNYLDAKTTTCPTGVKWNNYNNTSCWRNAASQNWTAVPLSQLSGVTLTATTNSNGTDAFSVTVAGKAYSIPATNTLLSLSGHWNDVDFNVFGENGSQEAFFNVGTLGAVNVAVNDGTANAPACSSPFSGGFGTLETTNLTLGQCGSVGRIGTVAPSVFFYESVPPVVSRVTANAGSAAGGETVTVNGQGFASDSIFKFGSGYVNPPIRCSADFSSCSMTTPPGVGTVPVTAANLTLAGGEGAFSPTGPSYTYKPVPKGHIQPSSGSPGTEVTMTGQNFSIAAGGTQVVFTVRGAPIAASNVTCSSPTQCTFFAPGFADLGNVAVPSTVLVTVNGETSSAGGFTFSLPTVKTPPVSCEVCRANGQTCKRVNGKNVCVGLPQ